MIIKLKNKITASFEWLFTIILTDYKFIKSVNMLIFNNWIDYNNLFVLFVELYHSHVKMYPNVIFFFAKTILIHYK